MFLDKFKEFPRNKVLYLIVITGFSIVLSVEILVFIPIEANVSGYGILEYEFAWTSTRVEQIFSIWGSSGIDNQIAAIYWDFLFIIGYVSLTFGLIIIVLRRSKGKIKTIGSFMTITPFLTGIFDAIENIFLILMANNPTKVSNPKPLIASLSAIGKFGFLLVVIIYFVIGLIVILIKKFKKGNELKSI
ncbi:MAG: hypothetical protein ACFFG0_50315 [Candidatus Thorarchaeota archaeon]